MAMKTLDVERTNRTAFVTGAIIDMHRFGTHYDTLHVHLAVLRPDGLTRLYVS